MINGLTFTNRITRSANDRYLHYCLNAKQDVIEKGCQVTLAASKVNISEGYFLCRGAHLQIQNGEELNIFASSGGPVPVDGQTRFCTLVFRLHLDQTNTTTEFVQGEFNILWSLTDYPAPTQQDIDASSSNVYEMVFATFKTANSAAQVNTLAEKAQIGTAIEKFVNSYHKVRVINTIPSSIDDDEIVFVY